jgi:hypothetical protein
VKLLSSVRQRSISASPAGPVLSYKMRTNRVGARRLHLAVWKHSVSRYGWPQGHDAWFIARL